MSSEEVQQKLAGVAANQSSLLLQFDVKEFFLSRNHIKLAEALSSHSSGKLPKWMRDAVAFALATQCVEWNNNEGRHFQVMKGSGMGIRHSGSISDAAFYTTCELSLACDLEKLDVECYIRFEDDIIVCLRNSIVGEP